MARAMPHYHLDLLCEEGALMGSIEFECTDDQTAKGHAQTVLSGYGGELWRRIDPDRRLMATAIRGFELTSRPSISIFVFRISKNNLES